MGTGAPLSTEPHVPGMSSVKTDTKPALVKFTVQRVRQTPIRVLKGETPSARRVGDFLVPLDSQLFGGMFCIFATSINNSGFICYRKWLINGRERGSEDQEAVPRRVQRQRGLEDLRPCNIGEKIHSVFLEIFCTADHKKSHMLFNIWYW